MMPERIDPKDTLRAEAAALSAAAQRLDLAIFGDAVGLPPAHPTPCAAIWGS